MCPVKIGSVALVMVVVLGAGGCAAPVAEQTASSATPAAVSTSANAPADQRGHVDAPIFLHAIADESVTVVDVRTPEECAAGHLPGAININVESPDFTTRIAELDPEGTYGLYCRSANRSRVAESQMQAAGFSRVFGLEGGVTALDADHLVTD